MPIGYPASKLDTYLGEFTGSHLQLHTGDPGAAGTANTTANVTGRKAVTFGSAETNSGTRRRRNSAIIRWDAGDVTGSASITHWTLWDASTSGNFLRSGTWTSTITATAGVPIEIQVNALEVNAQPLAS